jgi:hypothetical protein
MLSIFICILVIFLFWEISIEIFCVFLIHVFGGFAIEVGEVLFFYDYFGLFFLYCYDELGVHCGVYTGYYNVSNISYMNSSPQPFSFIPPTSDSCSHFKRNHFLHLLYMCTYFIATYSPSYPFSTKPPPSHGCQPFP